MRSEDASGRIRDWFDAALRAVDPERAVAKHLVRSNQAVTISGQRVDVAGRIVVIAVGKAAVPMARAAETALGDLIWTGIALTKDGHSSGVPFRAIQVREASHPIPDQRGVAATTEILDLLSRLTRDDFVIALISGGGSALLEAPVDAVSLEDVAAVTALLLKAGAPIEDLNAIRIPLSKVKGGGLRAASSARFATLVLSDVLGNDPRVIASGPTVPGSATGTRALELLSHYGVIDKTPVAVVDALRRHLPHVADRRDDILGIIADNQTAVDAFAEAARSDGTPARIAWTCQQGEARNLAKDWVALLANEDDSTLLLGGGEATVTVRGGGEGGRNTEFALAAALEMEARGLHNWVVASLATDGQDGTTGVAGALATSTTPERARAAGIDPVAALANNDSLAVFRGTGGLVETGPTGTNVNDIYVALRIE